MYQFCNETFVRLYSNYPNESQDLPDDLPSDCSISRVPVLGTNNPTEDDLGFSDQQMVAEGFLVQWMVADCSLCKKSNGQCGFSRSVSDFMCICSNGTGSDGTIYTTSWPVSGLTTAGALAFIIVCCIFVIKLQLLRNFFWKHNTPESIENILEKYGSLEPKKYKFSELKKIANLVKEDLAPFIETL